MAEGGIDRILCRYYLNGVCREGSKCNFSHDRETGKPDMICRYYLAGNCFYGDACRFDHIKPSRTRKPTKWDASNKSNSQSVKTSASKDEKNNAANENSKISNENSTRKKIEDWVNAPEFVPRQTMNKTYASVVKPVDYCEEEECSVLCMSGITCTDPHCLFVHGDLCEYCDCFALHPTDETLRKQHIEECIKMHEQLMEHSFAMARSKDKTCGICMDVVLDKDPPSSRRFGILPSCTHTFCLSCIRTWRQAKQFENKIIRACPECRVSSDFVVPSRYWVEDEQEKLQLFKDYKEALGRKPCKHFNEGQGECPFGNKCFYLHAYSDGTKVDLGPPKRRRRQNVDGEVELLESMLLWHFLEDRLLDSGEDDILLFWRQLDARFLESSSDSDSDYDYIEC